MLLTKPAINLRPTPLIPRGAGSKRKHIPSLEPILTSVPFNTVVEPFGGGLWITQALHQADFSTLERIIVAESMVDLRAVYKAWCEPMWRPAISKQLSHWQNMSIEKSWPMIKRTWEQSQKKGVATPLASAAGLALRIMTFSGFVRDTPGSSQLNIKWNKSQLPRWHPRLQETNAEGYPIGPALKFPHPAVIDWLAGNAPNCYVWKEHGYMPSYPASPKNLLVYKDFAKVVYPEDTSRTLAVCDPPYAGDIQDPPPSRRSGRYISPSYFHHRPHAQSTYDMAVHSVRAALEVGCHTVLGFNYDSERLHLDYVALAAEYGYQCDRMVGGRMTGCNNNVKPAKKETPYRDTTWVFVKNAN